VQNIRTREKELSVPRSARLVSFLTQRAAHQRSRFLIVFALLSATCLGLSQLSSYLVNTYIELGHSVVITSFLHFTHIRNMGGVFGLAQGQGWMFALFSLALISALVVYLLRSNQVRVYEFLCFGFIAGGGLGNILDRMIYGSVIDFIDVKGVPFWHYIFNTADTFIHIGLWPMLVIGIFFHKE
jgi:signal peptidase II